MLNGAAAHIIPAGRADAALADREILILEDQIDIQRLEHAQTGALGTRTERTVEGEHTGAEFFDGRAVFRTGIILREIQFLVPDDVHRQQPARQGGSGLYRIRQPPADAVFDDQSVDHDLHGVLFVFLQFDLFGEFPQFTVDAHSDITVLSRRIQFLDKLAFAPARERRQQLNAGAFRQL